MVELARKHNQVAPTPTDSPGQAQEQTPIPYWQRQPGEPLLWYNRYRLYRNLGYKRSLVAALQKERETAKVLESTGNSEKPGVKKSATKRSASHLVEVPKPTPVQAPGSWKQASIKYQWVERAAAYDEYRIDKMVDNAIDDLLDGPALAFNRVMMLKTLLENMRTNFNRNTPAMSLEQFCMMIARMQSLNKQIADEMANYDEALQRALLRNASARMYRQNKPVAQQQAIKAASREDYVKMMEQAGGPDAALAAIEQELRARGLTT